ncbi:dTMP kinase [Candidatus Omnitrophota bacterium]
MAKKSLKRGLFITFDGPDGSGKSTHARLAAKFLKKEGYDCLYTREPGGTRVGNKIRDVLLNLKRLHISALTETLLFEASRAELIRRVIKPALAKNKIVISDRFNDATLVYQGYAGHVPIHDIYKIESVSMKGQVPDFTIFFDIDAKVGLKRAGLKRKDRMERKKLSFHRAVRGGYLDLARCNKKRIKVIKTKATIDETFEIVKKEVLSVVRRYKRSR